MKKLLSIAFLALVAASCVLHPAPAASEAEFPVRTASVGGADYKYRLYVPPGRQAGGKLPVMLYLHGSDDRGSDNESQLNGLVPFIRERPGDFDFIVVVPQCPTDRFWDREQIEHAIRALDDTVTEFGADTDRLYLAGFSLGGYGVYHTAAMNPGKFAALVPMSGRLLPRREERKNLAREVAVLASKRDVFQAFAASIGQTPIWIFHGANDPIVSVDFSRRMDSALRASGSQNVKYTEVAGAGHELLGFKNPELFEWLRKQRRSG